MVIITISGDPGSGKSTLAKQLAEKLNLKHYSGGDIFRKVATEQGLSVEEFTKKAEKDPEAWDKKIDPYIEKLGKEEDDFVIDSRLGFHFIPKSTKIFVTCKHAVAAERLIKDQREEEKWESVEEGVRQLMERRSSERRRYLTLYNVDHTKKENFDFIIDSTELTKEEKLEKALKFLEAKT